MEMIMDDHDAKFKQLWNFRGEEDLAFVEWLKKKKNNQTYTSPKIQNEILKDMSFYTPWCCAQSYQKLRLSQYNVKWIFRYF